MKLKVYTEAPNQYRAILENFGGYIAGMVFNSSDELTAFIVEMPIDTVAILIHNQNSLPYGYRLDYETVKSAITFYQSGKRGRKRAIDVYCE